MKETFYTDKEKQKRYLKNIRQHKKEWRHKLSIVCPLLTIITIILIYDVISIITSQKSTIMFIIDLILTISVIISLIVCIRTLNKVKYRYAYPYSSYINGILALTDDKLTYTFWKITEDEQQIYKKEKQFEHNDRFVYTIKKSEIKRITIDEYNICTITGSGTLMRPLWDVKYEQGDTKEIIDKKDFSFLTSFKEENINQILKDYV